MRFMALGMKRDMALQITGLTKHQLYYKPKGGKRGRPPSTHTVRMEGAEPVNYANGAVVDLMKENHSDPDLRYGYHKMTSELRQCGFIINPKKVRRLMREHQMLQERRKSTGKIYVKYRIVLPEGPLTVFEMDIKYVWVEQHRRHAYVLTVLDTFNRAALAHRVGYSITRHQVKAVWEQIIEEYLQPYDMMSKSFDIEVRNDNDSRFSAELVQDFFAENYLNQVFTHPYTPEENGHIESFHSILGRSLNRQTFWNLEQLEDYLRTFYYKYNHIRLHGSIADLTPFTFWEQWEKGNIQRTVKDNYKVIFKLKIPYYQLSQNGSRSEASCFRSTSERNGEEYGAGTPKQPSVQRSPSVASC